MFNAATSAWASVLVQSRRKGQHGKSFGATYTVEYAPQRVLAGAGNNLTDVVSNGWQLM